MIDRGQVDARLTADEGRKDQLYRDSLGYWTGGIGHLLDPQLGAKLSNATIALWLDEDVADALAIAESFPWFAGLDAPRANVIACLCFNLGDRFCQFHQMHAALAAGDFDGAADQLLNSRWAKQVQPSRRDAYVRILRTGIWE